MAVLKKRDAGIRSRLAELQREGHEYISKLAAEAFGEERPEDDPVAAALDRGEAVIVPAWALPDEAASAGLRTGAQWSIDGVLINSCTWIRVDQNGSLSVVERMPEGAELVIAGGVTVAGIERG